MEWSIKCKIVVTYLEVDPLCLYSRTKLTFFKPCCNTAGHTCNLLLLVCPGYYYCFTHFSILISYWDDYVQINPQEVIRDRRGASLFSKSTFLFGHLLENNIKRKLLFTVPLRLNPSSESKLRLQYRRSIRTSQDPFKR